VAIISNAVTIADAGAFSVGLGDMTLIHTRANLIDNGSVSFVQGSDGVNFSTYPVYMFKFMNIHASINNTNFMVSFRDGDTNYDATCTTTMFSSRNNEADNDANIGYESSQDEAQDTGGVKLSVGVGTGSDESTSGELYLFNPSSTTFTKHFISTCTVVHHAEYNYNWYKTGYANVTAAIDAVKFTMNSGAIGDGTIKLYGLKDS
jgi:hypothetical protein